MEIKLYTFSTCPFCIKTKKILDEKGIAYDETVITREELPELAKKTGHPTVPQIFIDGELIGGYSDFKEKVLPTL